MIPVGTMGAAGADRGGGGSWGSEWLKLVFILGSAIFHP